MSRDLLTRMSIPSINNGRDEKFQHDILKESRHIRLLRVFRNRNSNKIHGEFTHTYLRESASEPSISYEAISYCWGDPSPGNRVWFGEDKYLDITQSAADVLDYIINSKREGYTWIDALCIDQSNPQEKNHQVRLMRDIYASAKQVIVWLGCRSANSDLAMDFIKDLALRIKGIYLRGDSSVDDFLSTLGESDSPEWMALSELIDRDWFSRLWTIQEIAVSSEATIVTGDKSVPWELLNTIIVEFNHRAVAYYKYLSIELDNRMFRLSIGFHKLIFVHTVCHSIQSLDQLSLQELVMECYRFSASNPLDKIFALLGLAKGSPDAIVDPDYTSSPRDVFTQTSRNFIIRNQSLEILHAAGIGWDRLLDSLPSWVPDWTIEFSEIWKSYKFNESTLLTTGSPERLNWKAAGSSKADIREGVESISDVDDIITIKATVFDFIVAFGPKLTLTDDRTSEFDFHSVYAQFIEELNPYPTGESSELLSWQLPICNYSHKSCGFAGPEYATYYQNFLAYLEHKRNGTLEENFWQIDDGVDEFYISLALFENLRLFRTSNGYAGLGPPKIFKDDKICLFHGAITPFIIRPNPRVEGEELTYVLVGECYVHGIMYGEGMGKGTMEDIRLR